MKRKRGRVDWAIAGLIIIVMIFVALLSNLEKGLAAGVSVGIFATIIQTKSETRKESLSDRRFWFVIAVLAVIHVVAISIIRFPELQAGLVSLPFALVDGFGMWGLINLIEKHWLKGSDRSES